MRVENNAWGSGASWGGRIATALLAVALGGASAHAAQLVFQQGVNGYTGHGGTSDSGDNFIYGHELAAELNHGAADFLRLSGSSYPDYYNLWIGITIQSVWKDIIGNGPTQIAPGSSVSSATLRLYAYEAIDTYEDTDVPLTIYSWKGQVYPGHYNGQRPGPAQDHPGDPEQWASTRGYRIFYTQPWEGDEWWVPRAGKDTTSDTPWDRVVISQEEHDNWTPRWIEFDVTDAVQAWVDGTEPNYGFAIFAETQVAGFHFHSSEYGTTPEEIALRPMLVVNIVPEPASISLLALGGLAFLRRRG